VEQEASLALLPALEKPALPFIPKVENCLLTCVPAHLGQATGSVLAALRTKCSKALPQVMHKYSYKGIALTPSLQNEKRWSPHF
jgi:carbonic anhydrase